MGIRGTTAQHLPSHFLPLEQELMDGGERNFPLWGLALRPLHRTRVIGSFHFVVVVVFFKFNRKVIFC